MDEDLVAKPLTDDYFALASLTGEDGRGFWATNAAPSSSVWLNKTATEILADVNVALTAVWAAGRVHAQRPDNFLPWWEGLADGLPKWTERPTMFPSIFGMLYDQRPKVLASMLYESQSPCPDHLIIPVRTYYAMRFNYSLLSKLLRGRKERRPMKFTRTLSKRWRPR